MSESPFSFTRTGTTVTACDNESGESESQVIRHDYCLVTDGGCWIDSVQAHGNGTHVIVVKGVQRG